MNIGVGTESAPSSSNVAPDDPLFARRSTNPMSEVSETTSVATMTDQEPVRMEDASIQTDIPMDSLNLSSSVAAESTESPSATLSSSDKTTTQNETDSPHQNGHVENSAMDIDEGLSLGGHESLFGSPSKFFIEIM